MLLFSIRIGNHPDRGHAKRDPLQQLRPLGPARDRGQIVNFPKSLLPSGSSLLLLKSWLLLDDIERRKNTKLAKIIFRNKLATVYDSTDDNLQGKSDNKQANIQKPTGNIQKSEDDLQDFIKDVISVINAWSWLWHLALTVKYKNLHCWDILPLQFDNS